MCKGLEAGRVWHFPAIGGQQCYWSIMQAMSEGRQCWSRKGWITWEPVGHIEELGLYPNSDEKPWMGFEQESPLIQLHYIFKKIFIKYSFCF